MKTGYTLRERIESLERPPFLILPAAGRFDLRNGGAAELDRLLARQLLPADLVAIEQQVSAAEAEQRTRESHRLAPRFRPAMDAPDGPDEQATCTMLEDAAARAAYQQTPEGRQARTVELLERNNDLLTRVLEQRR